MPGIQEEHMKLRHPFAAAVFSLAALSPSAQAADTTLDYNFFKTSVEPIFLKKRPEHVRCYVCHSESSNAFKLQHLAHGSKSYTDEQSRKNFESASSLVVPG